MKMMKILKIFLIFLILNLISGCSFKFSSKTNLNNNNQNLNQTEKKITQAIIKTNQGDIKLELFKDKTPNTVDNFIKLVNEGFYDKVKFHRVIIDFVIQTGDPQTKGVAGKDFVYDDQKNPNNLPLAGTGGPDYTFADEFSNLIFDKAGILAMANQGPNTNGSQFFITLAATPWLNNKHTIFGQVIEGMEIINKIEKGDWIENIEIINNP